MPYVSECTDGLTKWWVVGTGSVVNRLSEVMDDQDDGPYLNTGDVGAWTQTGGTNEWYMTVQTRPDGKNAGQDVYDTANSAWLTNDDGNEGSLAAGRWAYSGANVLTVRLGDDSDPNASDPYAYYDWSNFMTETVEDGIYLIHLPLEIGDGSTATTLTSKLGELVWFDAGVVFDIKNSASLTLGEKSGDWGEHGATWTISPSADVEFTGTTSGALNLYASTINIITDNNFNIYLGGTCEWLNTIFNHNRSTFKYIRIRYGSFTLKKVYISDTGALGIRVDPVAIDYLHIHNSIYGIYLTLAITSSVPNAIFSDPIYGVSVSTAGQSILSMVNPDEPLETPVITGIETNAVQEQYTVNIKVVDKNGTAISGATVLCEDKDDTEVFSETTDATGAIDEQTVTYKSWTGTSETEATYSPHKITISKAGYQTLTIDGMTINDKVDSTYELLAQNQPEEAWRYKMYKNTASQKAAIYAWDNANGVPKTGDAANITAQISIDGAAFAATDDVNPTELDATDAPGVYVFDLTQAETNGDLIIINAVSATADIDIRPVIAYTDPVTPTKAGYIDHSISTVDTVVDGIATDLGTLDGKVDTIDGNVDSILDDTAEIGVAGAGLTALGDARLDNLDAAISTRTKPADTQARVTLVDTCSVNSDMRGTDGANTVVPDAAGTAAALHATTDGKIDTIDGNVDSILVDTGTDIPTAIAALNDIAAADITGAEVDNDGTAISLAGAMKLILSVLTGKSSGGGTTTIVFRDIADSKDRMSVTVDSSGNRTAVGTRDAS